MIVWEEEASRKDQLKVENYFKIMNDYNKAIKEKKDNQQRLLHHLAEQKQKREFLDAQLDDVYFNVEKSAIKTADKIQMSYLNKSTLKAS
jgi:hypothetical protein